MGKPAHQIIKRPLLTEKGTRLRESGGHLPGTVSEEDLEPKVFFEVSIDANKIEIRQAVETLFNVEVVKVNTLNRKGKRKRNRRTGTFGSRSDAKRAIVTLAGDDRIDLFES